MNAPPSRSDTLIDLITSNPAQRSDGSQDAPPLPEGVADSTWGDFTSPAAADSLGPLGINSAGPMAKTGALTYYLRNEAEAMQKIAVLGVMRAGYGLLQKGLGGLNRASKASAGFFAKRRAKSTAATAASKAKRLEDHRARTQGMQGASRALADVGFHAKEKGRFAGSATLGLGGTFYTANDAADALNIKGPRHGTRGGYVG